MVSLQLIPTFTFFHSQSLPQIFHSYESSFCSFNYSTCSYPFYFVIFHFIFFHIFLFPETYFFTFLSFDISLLRGLGSFSPSFYFHFYFLFFYIPHSILLNTIHNVIEIEQFISSCASIFTNSLYF